MTSQVNPSPDSSNPAQTDQTSDPPPTPDADTGNNDTTVPADAAGTKPEKGTLTVDDKKRFLSEIVANHGLAKVGDQIAKAIEDAEPGGILIVDELAWSVNDVLYLDIRKKLQTLLKLSADAAKDCADFYKAQVEPKPMIDQLKALAEAKPEELRIFGLTSILGAAGTALAADAEGITAGLKALGDIIGYFRSDYEIKGQTTTNVDDLYIQLLVAGKLEEMKKDVYLLNFNFISQSPLIEDLGKLFEQKYQLLTCAEKTKSKFIDGKAAQVQALETHLSSLKTKLIEYLVKVDDDILMTLKKEIDQQAAQLKDLQAARVPDSQISALETYLSSLRTKLLDELIKDNAIAKTSLEVEIEKIIKKLEEKDNPNNKLTEVEVKALNDQLKMLQTRLADLLASTSSIAKAALKEEIEQVTNLLKTYQKARLPDSEISALETHLASLRAKLVECLVRNDDDALKSLNKEIEVTARQIEDCQKDMRPASGIVASSTKIVDAIDAFITAITTVPTGGTYSPLVNASIRENLSGDKIRYLLKIKMVSSDAEFIIEKPPFLVRNVRTSYIGGGVVSFVMAEKDGKIVAAGTVSGVATLDLKIGKEPEELKWKIR